MVAAEEIRDHVIARLENGLSPLLTYHNTAHTLDVLKQATDIAAKEGIAGEEPLLLLKMGALYHDTGFLHVYKGHEEESCRIARQELQDFGFGGRMIEQVCGMIMATRVPQKPLGKLEEILCDADLDYLGRPDFWITGEGLYAEFLWQQYISNEREWNLLQAGFLESHHYFTSSSQMSRQQQKQLHLEAIKAKIAEP